MKREHKTQIKMVVFLSLFILLIQTSNFINGKGEIHSEFPVLILTDNEADFELASLLKSNNDLNITIKDIYPTSNLNQLFNVENYFDNYDSIIIILNQIANPFNDSLESDLEHFISTGGLFGIVSAQIWKFTPSFHTLFGLEVPSQGPREFPQGNLSTNILVELINQSFLDIVDPSHPILSMEGCIGISSSIDQFKEIASIQTASGDASITAFSHINGFSFAVPFSPVEVSFAIENTSELISSIIEVGFNHIEQIAQSEPDNPSADANLLLLSLSEDPIAFTVVFGGVVALLSGSILFILDRLQRPALQFELKTDKSFILTYILGPLFAIGQILYPPIVRRIDRYDVVENEYRSRILSTLQEREFLHFRELKRELEIGTSSLKWHLQVLEDFRIIKRQDFGQYEIYYLYHKIPEPNFLDIYFAIVSGGGYRIAQAFSRVDSWKLNTLAEYLGQSKEATKYHLNKFVELLILKVVNNKYVISEDKKISLNKALVRRKKSS